MILSRWFYYIVNYKDYSSVYEIAISIGVDKGTWSIIEPSLAYFTSARDFEWGDYWFGEAEGGNGKGYSRWGCCDKRTGLEAGFGVATSRPQRLAETVKQTNRNIRAIYWAISSSLEVCTGSICHGEVSFAMESILAGLHSLGTNIEGHLPDAILAGVLLKPCSSFFYSISYQYTAGEAQAHPRRYHTKQ